MAAHVPRYAITFGDVSVLHVGGAEHRADGAGRPAGGFTVDELRQLSRRYPDESELVMVSDALPDDLRAENEAAVLVFRGGAQLMGVEPDDLLHEQRGVSYDTAYWDARRGATLNKQARLNTLFGDVAQAHSDDYCAPTINAFDDLPHLRDIRTELGKILGPKAANLNAEGNLYHKASSGIGFHGDAERVVVIGLSLGGSATLRYHWRLPGSSDHTFEPVDVAIDCGDVYVMSEKATGNDWRKRSKVRVVHAAGAKKYIGG